MRNLPKEAPHVRAFPIGIVETLIPLDVVVVHFTEVARVDVIGVVLAIATHPTLLLVLTFLTQGVVALEDAGQIPARKHLDLGGGAVHKIVIEHFISQMRMWIYLTQPVTDVTNQIIKILLGARSRKTLVILPLRGRYNSGIPHGSIFPTDTPIQHPIV
jgi:hypothetical protein